MSDLSDLMTTLAEDADAIYVRARIDGAWKTVALTDLSDDDAAAWVIRFIERSFPGSVNAAQLAEHAEVAS
jgi:hypothetical protein